MKDRGRRTWGWALGLGVVLALMVGVASAKKPPKPPPDPPPPVDTGLIYYFDQAEKVTCSMEPDGSNPQPATIPPGIEHDGYRWTLEYVWNSTDQQDEFWVVREDDAEEKFQLNFDSDVRVSKKYNIAWAVHDSAAHGKVSFLALRYDEAGDPVEYGLQVVYVDWTTKESTSAETLIPVGPYAGSADDYWWMSVRYDWSPDGTSLVYFNGWGGGGLTRVDCDFSTETWSADGLVDDGAGEDPHWSPDGTRIAFKSDGVFLRVLGTYVENIETIAPDGTNRTMVVEAGRKLTAWNHEWSPSGSHLVYNHRTIGSQPDYKVDIYRITKDGGDATNLTGELSCNPLVLVWLDE